MRLYIRSMANLNQTESPLACDMTAIPAAQRPVHLASRREGVKEFIREEISGLTGFTGFTRL